MVLPRAGERCELCADDIGDRHGHVVDVEARSLMCTCRGCYLLFAPEGAGGGHFKAVPPDCRRLASVQLSPLQWESLQIPVSVAFFFVNSSLDRVCSFYPSPAGATESLLPLDTWAEITATNPELETLMPDVEAFLLRSERPGASPECYVVPIDWCYELVGRLRQLWRGFDGGKEARRALEDFFERVRGSAR
ncbi:MAG: DUF5947 family protein [Acidimicrobiales bacterium]